ncbi:methyltransferase domain-containing protein [Fusibacter paucivorans]|uniref:Methyltransferase domain-containing protein n=1 Tax=Fusibacter paucivorans TaxID=76009 RepID=A0ABS5PP75_9FIRM|nr:methyltransferase domain-containing protein [Fusibacter paucivorans]MBS7526381.1 methyltransferase domain-containing protein [Fusibacter paucivorans]
MIITDMRALMLNKRAKANSEKLLNSLQIKEGDVIADVGSGGGYFTFEFAKMVKNEGKVFAIDDNEKLLDFIKRRIGMEKVQNIETIIANPLGFCLSGERCDLIFFRNVFHHIDDPVSYFQMLRQHLKPTGLVAIVEWKTHSRGHCKPEAEICQMMKKAGYRQMRTFDFLHNQSFNLFAPEAALEKDFDQDHVIISDKS